MFSKSCNAVARTSSTLLSGAVITGAVLVGSVATLAVAAGNADATDDIHWVLTLDLSEGQDAAFDTLMTEMVAATKEEAGAKNYEWHRNGKAVHIYERYETNGDAGIHLGNFGANFAERFLVILTPTGLQVYGSAEGGVREGLAGFGAEFYNQVGGFAQ